jgi:hypothetical protein
MIGRIYLDVGDKLGGDKTPPEPATILTRWGNPTERGPAPVWPWLHWSTAPRRGGPLNVAVRLARGQEAVIPSRRGPFWRLRIPRERIDLSEVARVHGGCVHRECDYPACPALYDAVATLSGEPGFERGWMMFPSFSLRMCPRHAALVWTDGSHVPAWVGDRTRRDGARCSCGHPLTGRTLGEYGDTYRTHLAEAVGE